MPLIATKIQRQVPPETISKGAKKMKTPTMTLSIRLSLFFFLIIGASIFETIINSRKRKAPINSGGTNINK